MKLTFYIPIYNWGPNPNDKAGATLGNYCYTYLEDLYLCEYDYDNKKELAVGHMEVSGEFPSQNTFEANK